jgi:hypothetical protein
MLVHVKQNYRVDLTLNFFLDEVTYLEACPWFSTEERSSRGDKPWA